MGRCGRRASLAGPSQIGGRRLPDPWPAGGASLGTCSGLLRKLTAGGPAVLPGTPAALCRGASTWQQSSGRWVLAAGRWQLGARLSVPDLRVGQCIRRQHVQQRLVTLRSGQTAVRARRGGGMRRTEARTGHGLRQAGRGLPSKAGWLPCDRGTVKAAAGRGSGRLQHGGQAHRGCPGKVRCVSFSMSLSTSGGSFCNNRRQARSAGRRLARSRTMQSHHRAAAELGASLHA